MEDLGFRQETGRYCYPIRLLQRSVRVGGVFALVIAATVLGEGRPQAAEVSPPDFEPKIVFATEILPLLQSRCFGCHGEGDEIQGGLNMTSLQGLCVGGESGEAAIVPGDPMQGSLVAAVRWDGLEMPPKESERLSSEQIELIRKWILAGAPWPSAAEREKILVAEQEQSAGSGLVQVATSGGTTTEWTTRRYRQEDIWAFQPLKQPSELVPAGLETGSEIDYFINRRLSEAEVTPNPSASPQDLIRRVSYGLTGLPPKPAEVDAFVAASYQDPEVAYRELVDRLLASPRYGEHWARHWLDVTRYADTGGMSNDYERSNMWRYRDYVIRSFNRDKPYDQFVREQIAGDELAEQSARARFVDDGLDGKQVEAALRALEKSGDYTEEEAEWLVATGFLRMGPWDNAMVEPEEARQMYIDDLVNITGQTFLSQTLRCCKCHDHKFDPIPTRDYYRLYSAFSTTFPAERPVRFMSREPQERFDSGRQFVGQMLTFAREQKQKLVDKQEAAARAWYEEHDLPYKAENDRKEDPDEMKPPRHVGLTVEDKGRLKVREQDEWIWERRLERYQPLAQSVFSSATIPVKFTGAKKLRIFRNPPSKGKSIEARILAGGALGAPGDIVRPGVLSAVSHAVHAVEEDPYLIPDHHAGRRTILARWIASPSNPLTTRSIVNRVWQFHFGAGLAANPNNFGGKGGKPTHPDLLDYLAGKFVEQGWSLKALHREILLSAAYRRSAEAVGQSVTEVDPDNHLLAKFGRRRLTAEEIRDSLLQITGELVHGDGGVPVFPEINMEVALQPRMIQFSLAPAYQPSATPEERNRRSIYAYACRGQADPFLELFNQPGPNESCEMRDTASLTPQALTLLNSDFMLARAAALCDRIDLDKTPLDDAMNAAFIAVLGRPATGAECDRLVDFCRDVSVSRDGSDSSVRYPTQITRTLVEEFSGEPFDYTEILPTFVAYQPDRAIAELGQLEQAFANVCLLLMNTNEFLFVN
jgi:hypothetical protein